MTKNHGGWDVEEEELTLLSANYPAFPDYQPDNTPTRHVVPVNDLFPHVLSYAHCWCHPRLDDDEPSVVVHNSADGREDYETGRRKLN